MFFCRLIVIHHLDKHIFLTILEEDKTYCIDHSFEHIKYLLKNISSVEWYDCCYL